jgi:hypothetical protein
MRRTALFLVMLIAALVVLIEARRPGAAEEAPVQLVSP